MDRLGSADVLLFEGFRFDLSGGDLFRLDEAGVAVPVVIGSRALGLLSLRRLRIFGQRDKLKADRSKGA
jgi:hypothetical protein